MPDALDVEAPDAMRSLVERIMMGIRLRDGLNAASITAEADRLRPGAGPAARSAAAALADEGLLDRDISTRWSLTDAGWLVTNRVVLALAEAVDPG
jgi:coproporphyrinogen III oxidase-like Fe-S oxidoreductase